jgi:extradiol dioxygenase family protein
MPRDVLEENQSRLRIHEWEWNRTHWAIKDGRVPQDILRKVSESPRSYDFVVSFAKTERQYARKLAHALRDGKATVLPMPNPFHLAFPVHDLHAARAFYAGTLGCPEGRSSDTWIDFDLFGHQIVAHLDAGSEKGQAPGPVASNPVDGHDVPVPHFGVVLDMDTWHALAERVKAAASSSSSSPMSASRASRASRRRCSSRDPSGNALEFKAFKPTWAASSRPERRARAAHRGLAIHRSARNGRRPPRQPNRFKFNHLPTVRDRAATTPEALTCYRCHARRTAA